MATTGSPIRMLGRIGDRRGRQVGIDVDAQQGEVVAGIGGNDGRWNRFGVAGEANPDILGTGDDVGVGKDLAVGGDDHSGAHCLAQSRCQHRWWR